MTKPGNTYAKRSLKPLVKLPTGQTLSSCKDCGTMLTRTNESHSPYGSYFTYRCAECGNRYQFRFVARPELAKFAVLAGRVVRD